jgi:hypothetical protein
MDEARNPSFHRKQAPGGFGMGVRPARAGKTDKDEGFPITIPTTAGYQLYLRPPGMTPLRTNAKTDEIIG